MMRMNRMVMGGGGGSGGGDDGGGGDGDDDDDDDDDHDHDHDHDHDDDDSDADDNTNNNGDDGDDDDEDDDGAAGRASGRYHVLHYTYNFAKHNVMSPTRFQIYVERYMDTVKVIHYLGVKVPRNPLATSIPFFFSFPNRQPTCI
eukprot:913185-Rhodomonas_salina.1